MKAAQAKGSEQEGQDALASRAYSVRPRVRDRPTAGRAWIVHPGPVAGNPEHWGLGGFVSRFTMSQPKHPAFPAFVEVVLEGKPPAFELRRPLDETAQLLGHGVQMLVVGDRQNQWWRFRRADGQPWGMAGR